MNIIVSKLRAPRRGHVLHRQRLIRLFDDLPGKKLVTVTAGAGYGKTTLVLDAMAASNMETLWYRLDEQDSDFFVFLSYLYRAVHVCFPGGSKTDTAVLNPGIKKQAECLLEWLAFLEKSVLSPAVLILDDYHLVQDSRQINQAVDFLLDRLPENIHLVVIGRKTVPLKISRFRILGRLTEITDTDLAFTIPEIKQFFSLPLSITDDQALDISSRTKGWAASLVLLRHAVFRQPMDNIQDRLSHLSQNTKDIFSYLKENVFDLQPEKVRDFMMKAALLPEIDTRLCYRIFGVKNTDKILNRMIKDHLMIFPVDDSGTVFYLHHLFKDFLIAQLHERFSPLKVYSLHRRIAGQTEDRDVFMALHHYIAGHAYEDAIRVIETHEIKFLLEGKLFFLSQCMDKIPQEVIAENPKLLLVQAKLFSHFGDSRRAMDLIIQAHHSFKKQGKAEQMVACLVELGSQYYFTGHVREAKLLMEQVIEDVEPKSTTYVMAMTFLTFLSSVLGEFETSMNYYDAAVQVIDKYPDFERNASRALIDTSLTHILYFKGDFEGSAQLSRRLLQRVSDLKIDPCLPLIYYQLSADCYFSGDFNGGCDFGKKGIDICEKMVLTDSRKAWVYLAWAQNCIGLGELDRAVALIGNSIALFEAPGNRWGLASAWEVHSRVFLACKKLLKAKQLLNQALDIITGHGLIITRGILENSLARIFLLEKEYDTALDYLEQSRGRLQTAGFHLFDNHMMTAEILLRTRKPERAGDHLSSAMALCEEYAYDRFVEKEKDWLLPVITLSEPFDIRLTKQAKTCLKRIFNIDAAAAAVPVLDLSLLGKFIVRKGGIPIDSSQFKSSNALMILKYLAAHRSRGFIHREILIDMLWPDEDIKKTGSRFNMAMSALRKTLEPGLPPKAPSAYIQRKKELYRLFDDSRIRIDTEAFLNCLKSVNKGGLSPEKELECLVYAQSLYNGRFLEEDPYQDWCMEKRTAFAMEYKTVLESISDRYETMKDLENACIYTQKCLSVDPFDEKIIKKLIRLYGQTGDLAGVIRTYAGYESLALEMDCPVRSDIKDLVSQLTNTR